MNSPETSTTDDSILLRQIALGDEAAFNQLFRNYWEKVYADAYRRLKDHAEAQDVVQEIFTNIWQNRQWQSIQYLPAYLHTAVRNRVINAMTKKKLVHAFFGLLDELQEHNAADTNLLWKEVVQAYEALLATLPPKRQAIFRMRYQQGLSTKDIADQLGIKRKTIQNQLGKAIDLFKISLLRIGLLVFVSMF